MDVADETVEETYWPPRSIAQDEGSFLMKVIGASMRNAHIKEGDMVLVHPTNQADNGDIVVAKIDDNGNEEITIKRFFREKDHIKLMPENKNYQPIIKESVALVGKVVGLIRLKVWLYILLKRGLYKPSFLLHNKYYYIKLIIYNL